MNELQRSGLRLLLAAGLSALALAAGVDPVAGQTSEIDVYDVAVRSQSKDEALRFIKTFSSSHLVGDLLESLPPDVARQVCDDLKGGGPAKARKACDALRGRLAAQPVEPAAGAPAAAVMTAAPVPPATPTPAPVPGGSDVSPGDLATGQGTGDTGKASSVQPFYVPPGNRAPAADTATVSPSSASQDTAASVSPAGEAEGNQSTDDMNKASAADLFYLPVANIAPAAGAAPADSVPTGTGMTPSALPAAKAARGQGTGDTDKTGPSILLPMVRMATAAPLAIGSSSVGMPVSTGASSDDEQNASGGNTDASATGGATDTGQADAADTGEGNASNGPIGNGQSSSDQASSGQSSSDQSGSVQSSESKSGKAKSDSEQSSGAQSSSSESSSAQSSKDKSSKADSSSDQSSSGQDSKGKSGKSQNGNDKKGNGNKDGKGGKGEGGKGPG